MLIIFTTSEGETLATFLHSSFLQAIDNFILWLIHVPKVPQASKHLRPVKLQTPCDICCPWQSYVSVHSLWLQHGQGSRSTGVFAADCAWWPHTVHKGGAGGQHQRYRICYHFLDQVLTPVLRLTPHLADMVGLFVSFLSVWICPIYTGRVQACLSKLTTCFLGSECEASIRVSTFYVKADNHSQCMEMVGLMVLFLCVWRCWQCWVSHGLFAQPPYCATCLYF